MDKVKGNVIFTPVVAALYYGVLIALLLFWSSGNIPDAVRYPFALLPFLPAILVDRRWFWPSFIVSLIVFNNIPGHQFLFNVGFYLAIIAVVVIYYTIRERQIIGPLEFLPFVLCVAYMSAIDNGSGDDLTDNRFWWLCVCALLTLRPRQQKADSQSSTEDNNTIWGAYAFVLASIIVSIVYALNFNTYAEKYNFTSEVMRSSYIDPNYQGGAIGMGVVFAIYLLLNNPSTSSGQAKVKKLWLRAMCIAGIVVPLITLFTLASRGSLLAVVIASALMVAVSNTKSYVKIGFVLLGVLLVAYSYSNNYMDLLIVRMQEKSMATGTHRTDIWASKLDAFTRDNNILHWIFGIGKINSLQLGEFKNASGGAAFHNQFLAMLVNYGIVGFCVFIYLMVLPIVKATKGKRMIVSILMLYLAVICLTLEPLTTAFPAFYLFYFYTYIFATRSGPLPIEEGNSGQSIPNCTL